MISASQGKRNKSAAAIKLHGVQVTDIETNTFLESALVDIEHTVGEPKTKVINNQFTKTLAPKVIELYAPMPHTAVMVNNKINK